MSTDKNAPLWSFQMIKLFAILLVSLSASLSFACNDSEGFTECFKYADAATCAKAGSSFKECFKYADAKTCAAGGTEEGFKECFKYADAATCASAGDGFKECFKYADAKTCAGR
jgi:hypothetical protein